MIDFNKLIDNYLHREFRPKKTGRYYPSEIAMCMRKLFYSYKFPRETEADLVKIFEAGNIMHDFVVDVLKSEKNSEVDLLKSEFPIKLNINNFIISGRVDDLLLLKASGKNVLVEVKSCRSLKYINEPLPHNLMQIQFYMFATQVHDGILLYIEKNTLQSKVFTIPYDELISVEAIERFKALNKFLLESKVPEPEAKLDDRKKWMCVWCEYRDMCDKE